VGQKGTRRERLVARVLVTLGVVGVLTLLGGGSVWMWQRHRPAVRAGEKEVHVPGCNHAYLDEPTGRGDARAQGNTLYCQLRYESLNCDQAMSSYIAFNGPRWKDVRVIVRRGEQMLCDQTYAGDGTPK
jgi:hypothetical protein